MMSVVAAGEHGERSKNTKKKNPSLVAFFLGHGAKLLRKSLRCSLEVCCVGMGLLQDMLACMTQHSWLEMAS